MPAHMTRTSNRHLQKIIISYMQKNRNEIQTKKR
jgi:hypothetical protein